MSKNVIRLIDYERRSHEPDAEQPRSPADATIIILPIVRTERYRDHKDDAGLTPRAAQQSCMGLTSLRHHVA
jgi:hypothetical protein